MAFSRLTSVTGNKVSDVAGLISVSVNVFGKFCVSDQKKNFRPRTTLGLSNFDALVWGQN